MGSYLARARCCRYTITLGLINQKRILRKQNQFKLVSVLHAVSFTYNGCFN